MTKQPNVPKPTASVARAAPHRAASDAAKTSKRHILLTGATGFVGKVVLSELVREAQQAHIDSVTLLIRRQKGRSPKERFEQQILASAAFAGVTQEVERLVEVHEADLLAANLGLTDHAAARIAERTTHIIHCAASVDFDRPIKEAAASNIDASLRLLTFAKQMPALERMVVASTAYVTPWRDGPIRPELVALPRSASAIYADLQNDVPEQQLLDELGHANTYTFTKCIGEHLLAERREHVAISIVRPSIVSASWQRPFPGWIDSRAAFAGFVVTIGMGLLKVIDANPRDKLDLVPVDVVAERLIGAAFAPPDAATKAGSRAAQAQKVQPAHGVPISYAVAGPRQGALIGETSQAIVDYFQKRPIGRRAQLHYVGPRNWQFLLTEALRQSLPLGVAKVASTLRRDLARARKVARTAKTLATINSVFPYFTSHTFQFVVDEPLPADFDVRKYVDRVCAGAYTHLLHRDGRQVPLLGGGAKRQSLRADWAATAPAGTSPSRVEALYHLRLAEKLHGEITLDEPSFLRARAAIGLQGRLALLPLGDAAVAATLCKLLVLKRPDLGFQLDDVVVLGTPPVGQAAQAAQADDLPSAESLAELAKRREFGGVLLVTVATPSPSPTAERGRRLSALVLRALPGAAARAPSAKRVHLRAGPPLLFMAKQSGTELLRRLQAARSEQVVVSRAGLQAFLWLQPQVGLDLGQLTQAVSVRGGQVLGGAGGKARAIVDIDEERRERRRWQTLFHPDLMTRFAHAWPIRFVSTGSLAPVSVAAAGPSERRLARLLHALAAPIVSDFAAVVRGIDRLLAVGERATARALLAEAQVHDEHMALGALVAACEAGLLEREEPHGFGQSTVVLRRVGDEEVVRGLLLGCHLAPTQERSKQHVRPAKVASARTTAATLH